MKKIARLVKIFSAYTLRKQQIGYMPIRLWIEATDNCNLKCTMCPNKDLKDKGFMELKTYKKIIDEIKGKANDIALNHRGESLLHPKLPEMIGYAAKNNINVKLHTNATLLNKRLSTKLLKSGLHLLSFSFDGYSKEIYEKIRVGADFDKTLKKIKECVALKKKLKSNTHIVLEVIDFKKYSTKNLDRYKDLGVDEIIIKKLHNWGGKASTGKSKAKNNNKKFHACTFPWYSLTILWDGTVVLCPQDFFAKIRLGNIKKQGIAEIWNSKKMQDIRIKMKEKRFPSPCNKCDRIRRKTFLGVPVEFLRPFIKENIFGFRK